MIYLASTIAVVLILLMISLVVYNYKYEQLGFDSAFEYLFYILVAGLGSALIINGFMGA